MDRKPRRTAPALAASSLLRRWFSPPAPQMAVDSSQMDLGYESALPWFSDAETRPAASNPEVGQPSS
jgi:hypothetical protein